MKITKSIIFIGIGLLPVAIIALCTIYYVLITVASMAFNLEVTEVSLPNIAGLGFLWSLHTFWWLTPISFVIALAEYKLTLQK